MYDRKWQLGEAAGEDSPDVKAWIPSYTTIGDHPKTRKLARRLDVSIPAAVGHLHLLWHWALTYAEDGNLSHHDADDIALGARYEGDAAGFLEALVESGFVDRTRRRGRRLVLHDWEDYAGRYVKALTAQREGGRKGARKRWGSGPPNEEPNGSPIGEPNRRIEKKRRDKKNLGGESAAEEQGARHHLVGPSPWQLDEDGKAVRKEQSPEEVDEAVQLLEDKFGAQRVTEIEDEQQEDQERGRPNWGTVT